MHAEQAAAPAIGRSDPTWAHYRAQDPGASNWRIRAPAHYRADGRPAIRGHDPGGHASSGLGARLTWPRRRASRRPRSGASERGHIPEMTLATIRRSRPRSRSASSCCLVAAAPTSIGSSTRGTRRSTISRSSRSRTTFRSGCWRPRCRSRSTAERGVIDISLWHPGRRALLIIELKTEHRRRRTSCSGTMDRAAAARAWIVEQRGWNPETVSAWVDRRPGADEPRRIAAHRRCFARPTRPMVARCGDGSWTRKARSPLSRPGRSRQNGRLRPVRRVRQTRLASGADSSASSCLIRASRR